MIPFDLIKSKALSLGWDDAGACLPEVPEEDVRAWKSWVESGLHADLAYMENPLRGSPQSLFPGAKTALIFVSYYKQEKVPFSPEKGVIASYARGRDYHHVHRKRLKKMIAYLEEISGQKDIARGFSDSFPLLEKALAVKAGLGWFGKNTLLIHKNFGTFTLLSGLLTSLEIEIAQKPDLRLPKCGSCTRCIDSCPTGAITSPYLLDAKKCLSYQLIESKKTIPEEIAKKNPGYLFGCDLCQDVCPHNQRKPLSTTDEFKPEYGMGGSLTFDELESLKSKPETLFGTPLQRKKLEGLIENAQSLEAKND